MCFFFETADRFTFNPSCMSSMHDVTLHTSTHSSSWPIHYPINVTIHLADRVYLDTARTPFSPTKATCRSHDGGCNLVWVPTPTSKLLLVLDTSIA